MIVVYFCFTVLVVSAENSRSRSTDRHSKPASNIPTNTSHPGSQLKPPSNTIYSKINKPVVRPDRSQSTDRAQSYPKQQHKQSQQQANRRPHSLHYGQQEDDRLLEQIKAQNSPMTDSGRSASYRKQHQDSGNVYENLADLQSPHMSPEYEERASIHTKPHNEDVHSIANHDYFYPPTIHGQSSKMQNPPSQSHHSWQHPSKRSQSPASNRNIDQSHNRGPVHSSPRIQSQDYQYSPAHQPSQSQHQTEKSRQKAVYFAEPAEAVYSNNEQVGELFYIIMFSSDIDRMRKYA